MIDPNAISEAQYDRYDDAGVHDAAELRAITGYEPDAADFSVEAIMARNPNLHFTDVAPAPEPTPVSGRKPDGLNKRNWEQSFQDPAQRRIHHAGIRAARQALGHAIED